MVKVQKSRKGRAEAQSLRDNLGKFIANKRASLNLTQVDLAQHAGVAQSNIARMEKGTTLTDTIPFSALSLALGISEEEMKWAMVGMDYLGRLRGADLISVVRAIAESNIKTLPLSDLLALLKVESSFRNSGLTMTKEMVPALLNQVRVP